MGFKQMQGPRQVGRNGLGIAKLPPIPEKNTYDYRKLVSTTSRQINEEEHSQKALQLTLQCHWMSWENYIKYNLSWSNILAMPPNLLSFCIASTYNVLPSPSNLNRWQLSSDPSCFLCNKNICTIAHILGACPFSLNQGRFTYRHDSILNYLVSILTSFIKEKSRTKPKKVNKIHFVKEGQKPPSHSEKVSGILHLTSDWTILADIDDNYIFPVQIALTQLRPDIVVFSTSLKRVVLIELTSPCEENMNNWHVTKLNKYASLLKVITMNKWHVDLFAVEVGARGYVSTSLSGCLKRLGLPRNLSRDTIKNVGRISMECSFCIWLCRNSKDWVRPLLNSEPRKTQSVPSKSRESLNLKNSKTREAQVITKNQNIQFQHAGLNNKGNTCYVNAILQSLSTIPHFWSQQLSESGIISPFARSLSNNLSLLKKRSSPVDPSDFLRALQNLVSISRHTPFNVNTQQDAPEIFQIIINELKESSVVADDALSSSLRTTTSCEHCHSFTCVETKEDIIQLPLAKSIRASLNSFLSSEYLRENDQWLCPSCNILQDSERITKFVNCGNILIIQLRRFNNFNGRCFKDNRRVDFYNDSLTVPVKADDTVTLNKVFKLKASINHCGTIDAGHYWAFIREETSNSWLKCNDTSIIKVNFKDLSNDSSYMLVYSIL